MSQEQSFKLKNKLPPFTQIPNDLITGPLSPLAKATYCYLASRPDEWDFWFTNIVKVMGVGVSSIKKAMKELVNGGWIARHQTRSGGRWGATTYQINYISSASPWVKNGGTVAVLPLPCDGTQPTYKYLPPITTKNKDKSLAGSVKRENIKTLKELKEHLIQKYNNTNAEWQGVCGYTSLTIKNGYLHNTVSKKDLAPGEAIEVWGEIAQNYLQASA